jgi:hypothetical protein
VYVYITLINNNKINYTLGYTSEILYVFLNSTGIQITYIIYKHILLLYIVIQYTYVFTKAYIYIHVHTIEYYTSFFTKAYIEYYTSFLQKEALPVICDNRDEPGNIIISLIR